MSPTPRQSPPPQHHLVVVHRRFLNLMITGRKTIECRMSKTKRVPFDRVRRGDHLWLKVPSGPILARARASRARYFHPVTPELLARLCREFRSRICIDADFILSCTDTRFVTLVCLAGVAPIAPVLIRKADRRAWMLLDASPTTRPADLSRSVSRG